MLVSPSACRDSAHYRRQAALRSQANYRDVPPLDNADECR